ncbi:Uncharacterised protein [Bordetella pertussis]|nr:Uncharacterised protein [Bordetella pertussis]
MMALSPLASDRDRCKVAGRCSPGTLSVTTVNGSLASVSTASRTLAKLSSTYCAQAARVSPGVLPSYSGYEDSASHSTLATSPASFMPSVVEIS